jgi:cytochrome c-type biogenesis protein CcmH/NrfG
MDFSNHEFWFLKGCESFEKKEFDSAIDSFRQSIRLNPYNTDSMHNLGCCYENQMRFEMG